MCVSSKKEASVIISIVETTRIARCVKNRFNMEIVMLGKFAK
jgi:hypothetical protein